MNKTTSFLLILFNIYIGLNSVKAGELKDYFYTEVMINGKPERFVFDTCTSSTIWVSDKFVKSNDLKIIRKTKPHTTKLDIKFQNNETLFLNKKIHINNIHGNINGCIGWRWIKSQISHLDGSNREVKLLKVLPKDLTGWHKVPIKEKSLILSFDVPDKNGETITVALDTGASDNISVRRSNWPKFKSKNKCNWISLSASFSPAAGGFTTSETTYIQSFNLGPFKYEDCLIKEDFVLEKYFNSGMANFDYRMGVQSLLGHEIIIDGPNANLYVKKQPTKKNLLLPYKYNRAGIVFLPKNLKSPNLYAVVIKDSAAYNAGIRNGDQLLEINGSKDWLNWLDTPKIRPNSHFEGKSGTQLNLTVRRDGKILKILLKLQSTPWD